MGTCTSKSAASHNHTSLQVMIPPFDDSSSSFSPSTSSQPQTLTTISIMPQTSPTNSPSPEDECFRFSIETFDTSTNRTYSQEYHDHHSLLRQQDFQILNLLQEGATGKVYRGKDKDGKDVALKLFGYSQSNLEPQHVYHEIQVMNQFAGISGVVQLLGYFLDTQEGLLPNRLSPNPYPVIVMELLEGGEVFNKIYKDKVVESERDLARLFRRIVLAVQSIHEHHYIHRDIKLENLMFLDVFEDSPVKIIDLGSMVSISKCSDGVYRDCGLVGTCGFMAPESVQHFDYSPSSDIWQLGCCLYSILSGHSPFGSENNSTRFLPMSGVAWNGISSDAKDLVKRMLQRSSTARISLPEILSHPWILNDKLSINSLSEDYYQRMKYLALRQSMKLFFLDAQVSQSNRDRRKKLKKLIPLLHQSSSLSSCHSHSHFSSSNRSSPRSAPTPQLKSAYSTPYPLPPPPPPPSTSMSLKRCLSIDTPEQRSKKVPNLLPQKNVDTFRLPHPIVTTPSEKLETRLESFRSAMLESFSTSCDFISYDVFRSLLIESELSELATKRVFNIFDLDRSGMIDMKDFLLTMAALSFGKNSSRRLSLDSTSPEAQSSKSPEKMSESNHSLAQLYFSIFDVTGRGFIELDQMKLAIDYILFHDDEELGPQKIEKSSPRRSRDEVFDVEMLFASIDTDGNGRIYFDQFSSFFNKLRGSTI